MSEHEHATAPGEDICIWCDGKVGGKTTPSPPPSDGLDKDMNIDDAPITRYRLVMSDDSQNFQDDINLALHDGWQLYGNPFTKESISGGTIATGYGATPAPRIETYNVFCQAMTLELEAPRRRHP